MKRNEAKNIVRPALGAAAVLAVLAAIAAPAAAQTGASAAKADVAAGGAADPRGESVNLLFIHHSCGGQLLAAPGERQGGERGSGERCIYVSHPNGGGLRGRLEKAGYTVNELSYESVLGEDTDICHWRAKFSDHLEELLRTRRQDEKLPAGETNRVVVFKSCYPNNAFVGLGEEPGDPDDCTLTVANARAAYGALLPIFARHPDVLFIPFTAPARVEPQPAGWKAKVKSWFRKDGSADLAREFNTWLADPRGGWLAGYEAGNVAVFDYYDLLTGSGQSNWSRYGSHGGRDSHPSQEGNALAADAFMDLLASLEAQPGRTASP